MILEVISVTLYVLTLAIFARALMSWFPNLDRRNPIVEFLYTITEPILAPIRSVMPRMGGLDLSPMIAMVLLAYVAPVIINRIASG